MSYDAYMRIDTGGEYPATVHEIGNMTSNVSHMWTKALGRPLRDFEGWPGGVLIPLLEGAIQHIDQHRAEYEAVNPPNGWGSVDSARRYLASILEGCRKHPKALLALSF